MKKLKIILLILLTFFWVDPASSRDGKRSNLISSSQARQMAEERFGGKALSASLVEAGDNSAYRVKLIKGGRVRVVTIPAQR